jgi:cytochrome b involved in lipid metabolism
MSMATFADMAAVEAYQAQHPDKHICVYQSKVIDVTKFVDEHPGGPDPFDGTKGADITKAFADVGHSSIAEEQIDDFVIGTLVATAGGVSSEEARRAEIAARRPSWIRTEGLPLIGGLLAAAIVYVLVARRAKA